MHTRLDTLEHAQIQRLLSIIIISLTLIISFGECTFSWNDNIIIQ